jgi:prepilin-type N-terminal cleavage/methylation domain-containing protein
MKKFKNLNARGFTIVELLIVIVVIGILAGLVFVQFNNVQGKARDSERKADIRLIESKLAEFRSDTGGYPAALADLTDVPAEALAGPKTNETYTYAPTPNGCTTAAADCTGYTLSSTNMEKETNPYSRSQQ